MNIAVSGKLGVKMFVLRSRLERILKAEVPDVVILYSDSDLSNQNEDILSIQEKYMLREHYRANFTLIVESILATNVKLALSGIGFSKQYFTCSGIFINASHPVVSPFSSKLERYHHRRTTTRPTITSYPLYNHLQAPGYWERARFIKCQTLQDSSTKMVRGNYGDLFREPFI